MEAIKANIIGWTIFQWAQQHLVIIHKKDRYHEEFQPSQQRFWKWEGTATELLNALQGFSEAQATYSTRSRYFPKNAHVLSRRINEVIEPLNRHGIEIIRYKSGQRFMSINISMSVKELERLIGDISLDA